MPTETEVQLSGDTLIIFAGWDEIRLFVLNWHECSKYISVDNEFMDELNSNSTVGGLIEHLSYMLGIETYYGESIPEYKPGRVTNHDDDWESGKDHPPAVAPWACREIKGPVVNFRKIIRIIRTGWYP